MEVKSLVEGLFDDLYNARIDKFIDRLDKDIYLSLPRILRFKSKNNGK
jgi:hypothetical protein